MATLARYSLLLVIVLVTLSAYLRLDHSGIGCKPWPACYGNIGVPTENPGAANTYERLLEEASQPLSWATPLHRLVASVLGLMVLAMALMSLHQRKNRLVAFGLLGLTVFLAWLGIYSEGLNSPAIVMGNLGGGFAMLGLLGWMVLGKARARNPGHPFLRRASIAALVVLVLQIAVGGLTSANFAASACQTLPSCHGSWLPGADIVTALDLSRVHEVGPTGRVLGGPERAAIHKLHRIVAAIAVAMLLFAGITAFRAGPDFKIVSITLIALVSIEFSLGLAAIVSGLPIGVAVAHNWIAGLLLLTTIRLLAESRSGPQQL
jgi:cytochrome c oxidase assembly protein subunit 15